MIKRTTVAANTDDLAILEREAKRRGVPLNHILREAVTKYAAEIRTTRRPHLGIAHVEANVSQMSVDDEDAPYREKFEGR
ncbi:MAG: ribbon-helix-helix protein, CopG family [Dehalococcoidia bacterium]